MTVAELFKAKYPKIFKEWDTWDYKVYAPLGLDEEVEITVVLNWESGRRERLHIDISSRIDT